MDHWSLVRQRDRRHRAIGAAGDRTILGAERERKGIEDGSAGVEPVPRTSPDRPHRDQSVGSGRGALCEQGRLGWWLSEDLERRWRAREVVCVDLVIGAAA